MSVTPVHPTKAVGRNEMSFVGDTRVAPSNTVLSLYHNCDSTTTRRRYYDEKLACSFLLASNWKQASAIRRSRIVVGS